MPNQIKWDAEDGSPTTILSTELNSLGDGTTSAASAEYDNGTNLNQYGWLEIVLGSLTPAAGNYALIYMYVFSGGTSEDAAGLIPLLPLNFTTATEGKRLVSRRFELPPFGVKFTFENQLGVALASSGNTVKLYVANDEVQ